MPPWGKEEADIVNSKKDPKVAFKVECTQTYACSRCKFEYFQWSNSTTVSPINSHVFETAAQSIPTACRPVLHS